MALILVITSAPKGCWRLSIEATATGVPVLTSYGATEFGGGVAGWNLADHEQFAQVKRGSVGRAHAGCSLRVVDPDDGADLGLDTVGLLEVRAAQLGTDEWVRTAGVAGRAGLGRGALTRPTYHPPEATVNRRV